MASPHPLVEICVENAQGVKAAQEGGAQRVELCEDLRFGGLTPSIETVLESMSYAPEGGIAILIRNRPGDFLFSPSDIARMCTQISQLKNATDEWNASTGSHVPVSFVVGALTKHHEIDEGAIVAFRDSAQGDFLALHRASDDIPNLVESLPDLHHLGIRRILTTGHGEGIAHPGNLKAIIDAAAHSFPDMEILASGGLRAENVKEIITLTGASHVHMRAPFADGTGTDPQAVREIVAAVRS